MANTEVIRSFPEGVQARIESGPMPDENRIGPLVGSALKALRVQRGWTQDEVARHLREGGLRWTREQVSQVEGGRRDVGLDELILVSETFGVRLADMIQGADETPIRLGDTERPAAAVRAALRGEPPTDLGLYGPVDMPGMSPETHGPGPFWVKNLPRLSVVYTGGEVDAAKRLGVPVEDIREAEADLWDGRILDVVREKNLEDARRKAQVGRAARRGTLPEPKIEDITEQLLEQLRGWLRNRGDAR